MSALRKRTLVTLPQEVKNAIEIIAKRENKSISRTAAELIELALMIEEDFALDEIAKERTRKQHRLLSHDEVWK